MYVRVVSSTARALLLVALVTVPASAAQEQPPPDATGWPDAAAKAQEPVPHDMQHMHDVGSMVMPSSRDGSGTSWLPDDAPMYALHRQAGDWTLMAHANAFVQYLHESGDRGASQFGSINWFMGMADRTIGRGHLGFRGMVSLEPWTIRGCGYPDLLASGELCGGEVIHDRQHPHDLVMELAAVYDRPLAGAIRLQLYGGPAGEPALGPTAFPHRISAMPSPLAPITHHWLDATHITYGVITGGVYGSRWKAETSLFNGREPDETRTNLDVARLDSWSGRVWWLPTGRWAFQVSAGRLTEAEASEGGGPRTDVVRTTASATYHRLLRPRSIWASTAAWGRNDEPGHDATNAVLAETNLTLDDRHSWFARFELSQKSAHDLDVDATGVFTVAKLAGGYTRYFAAQHGFAPGVGGGLSAGFVPEALMPLYGRRVNPGIAVFVTLRPVTQKS
jgi:hypothetical protein